MLKRFLKLSLLVLCALTIASEVRADAVDDPINAEMTALAENLKPYLDRHRYKTIFVGPFDAPGKVRGSAGPAMQLKLTEALIELGYLVKTSGYQVEIRGEYAPVFEDGLFAAAIQIKLVDEFGTPLVQMERRLYGAVAVPQLFGLSVTTRPAADYPERSEKWMEAYEHPQVQLNGSVIANSDKSPYAVEILVKRNCGYELVIPETKTAPNRPLVHLQQQGVYAVRLINNSKYDAAVNLTIDGLSVFEFVTENPRPTHWVVPAGATMLIKGWYRTPTDTREFNSQGIPQPLAGKLTLKPHNQFGLIHATFSAAWSGDKQPEDEPVARSTDLEKYIHVSSRQMKLRVGEVRESLAVRYLRGKE